MLERSRAADPEPVAVFLAREVSSLLIGEAADAFADQLGRAVDHVKCGTLDHAVAQAAADASFSPADEPVVLLSPACASYDQFANFEERGQSFRKLVMALNGVQPVARGKGKAA